MSEVNPLHSLFFNVAEALSQDELKTLKRLVEGEQITIREIEKIETAEDLFIKLKQKGFMSETNLTFLKELLERLGRRDLVNLVETFEADQPKFHTGGGDGQQHGHGTEVVTKFEDYLRKYFKRYQILPFPWWRGTERCKLEDVYVDLDLHTIGRRKHQITTDEILSNKGVGAGKRILILGDSGYGKSTFCRKLAYDWANHGAESSDHYKLLFLLELKRLYEHHKKTGKPEILRDVLFDLVLRGDENEKQKLYDFIDNNQSQVCFVFDGMDEVAYDYLPLYFKDMIKEKRRLLPDCLVIVTSRKIRENVSEEMYDYQLNITGFQEHKAQQLIEKYMLVRQQDETSNLIDEINNHDHKELLFNFMQSPLNAMLLFEIWIKNRQLPHTVTKLYKDFLGCVCNWYCEEHGKDYRMVNESLCILCSLSYIKLRALEFSFSENDLRNQRILLELGLLTESKEHRSSASPSYTFQHSSFLSFFAAFHIDYLCKNRREEFCRVITDLHDDDLLIFLAGMSENNMNEILKVWKTLGFKNPDDVNVLPALYEMDANKVTAAESDIISYCAAFLPEHLELILTEHTLKTRFHINKSLIECSSIRSKSINLILHLFSLDACDKCKQYLWALKGNEKELTINLTLICDLDDINFSNSAQIRSLFLNNRTRPGTSQPFLNRVTVHLSQFTGIADEVNCDSLLSELLRQITAKQIVIRGLPDGGTKLIERLLSGTVGSESLNEVDIICTERLHGTRKVVKANFGNINTTYTIYSDKCCLVELCRMFSKSELGEHGCALEITLEGNLKEEDIAEEIQSLVQFGPCINRLACHIPYDAYRDEPSDVKHLSSVVQSLSQISSKHLCISGLPLTDIEFIKSVFSNVSQHHSRKSVNVMFLNCKWSIAARFRALEIKINCGNLQATFKIDFMTFPLEQLRELLASYDAERRPSAIITCDLADALSYSSRLLPIKRINCETTYVLFNADNVLCDDEVKNGCRYLRETAQCLADDFDVAKIIFILPMCTFNTYEMAIYHLEEELTAEEVYIMFQNNVRKLMETNTIALNAKIGKFSILIGYGANSKHSLKILQDVIGRQDSALNTNFYLELMITLDVRTSLTESDRTVLTELRAFDFKRFGLKLGCNEYLTSQHSDCVEEIMQAVEKISTEKLVILLPSNASFIKCAERQLNWNQSLKSVSIDLCDNRVEPGQTVRILETCGPFEADFVMNAMSFEMNNLCESHLFDSGNEIGRHIEITSDFSRQNDALVIETVLAKLASVEITSIIWNVSGFANLHDDNILCCFVKHMEKFKSANVRHQRLCIDCLPLRNLTSTETLVTELSIYRSTKSFYVIFAQDPPIHGRAYKLNMITRVGRFCFFFQINDLNFYLKNLYELLLKHRTDDNPKVAFEIDINCDLKTSDGARNIELILQKLNGVMIDILTLRIGDHSPTIINACSRLLGEYLKLTCATQLVIKELPMYGFDFVENVHKSLRNCLFFEKVHIDFQDDSLVPLQQSRLVIRADAGKFETDFRLNNLSFDLTLLYSFLSKYVSNDVSLNIDMFCDLREEDEESNIEEMLNRMASVEIETMALDFTVSPRSGKQEIQHRIACIKESLSNINCRERIQISGLTMYDSNDSRHRVIKVVVAIAIIVLVILYAFRVPLSHLGQ